MKKCFLPLLLFFFFISCSKDEVRNAGPSNFELEDLSFTGTYLSLSWTPATDADEDRIYYHVYINSELVEGPITKTNSNATLEYNKDYEGVIIATDKKGGTSELSFTFRSPTSKIILVRDTQNNKLVAIDLHTRLAIFKETSVDDVHSVHKNLVFTGYPNLTAYNFITGEKIWEAEPAERNYDINYRHIMVDDNFVYAKSADYWLLSIDLRRREKQWETSLFHSVYKYATDNTALYVPKRNNGDLIKVNKNSGETAWAFELDRTESGSSAEVEHPPLVVDNNLYFQDYGGNFYSVDKNTGVKNYSVFIGKASESTPVWFNGNVIFTARDEIISVKAENGQINWRYNFKELSKSSPFEKNGLIYVGAGEHLYCLDGRTGNLRWRTYLGGETTSSPIVYEQYVYITSHKALLYCINANSGSLEWKTQPVIFSTSSPTLVIGESEEVIYPTNAGYQH